ncbi:OsmC family protein [Streptomyces sp. NPDC001165]|uniref:OsmC family protein n=1 Tax=Streptomyces sp. NPDC001165 TaxID=3364546 RepID=UPI0036B9EB63
MPWPGRPHPPVVAPQGRATSAPNIRRRRDDHPPARGPTPGEVLVVSLASCVAYYAGRFFERHHLDREQLRVLADFTMADDRPARIASVRLRVLVPHELSGARLEALRAVVDHCTVHNTLRQPPEIQIEFG